MFAHAFEDPANRLVGLVGGDAELVEFAAVRVVDIFRQRNIGRIIEERLITDSSRSWMVVPVTMLCWAQ